MNVPHALFLLPLLGCGTGSPLDPVPTDSPTDSPADTEIEVISPVNRGCSVSFSGTAAPPGAAALPISWVDETSCSILHVTTDPGGDTYWHAVIVHDAPMPPEGGVEASSVQSFTDYITAGGTVFGMVFFGPQSAELTPHASPTVQDTSFLSGIGLGLTVFDPEQSSYELSEVDTTEQTFRYTANLTHLGGTLIWPPPAADPNSSDPGQRDVAAFFDYGGESTLSISGSYDIFEFVLDTTP